MSQTYVSHKKNIWNIFQKQQYGFVFEPLGLIDMEKKREKILFVYNDICCTSISRSLPMFTACSVCVFFSLRENHNIIIYLRIIFVVVACTMKLFNSYLMTIWAQWRLTCFFSLFFRCPYLARSHWTIFAMEIRWFPIVQNDRFQIEIEQFIFDIILWLRVHIVHTLVCSHFEPAHAQLFIQFRFAFFARTQKKAMLNAHRFE